MTDSPNPSSTTSNPPEVDLPSEDSRLADLAFLMRFIPLNVLARPAVKDAVNRLVEVLVDSECNCEHPGRDAGFHDHGCKALA